MSSTILLPHTHSFVIGPAVINTHINPEALHEEWLSTRKSTPHVGPRRGVLSPWRRLSLPIPCHVHWPRSCCRRRTRAAAVCKEACYRIRKPDVRDVSGMLVERVFLVSGVVKTVFSPNKKNKRRFFFFYHEQKRVKPTSWVFLNRLSSLGEL